MAGRRINSYDEVAERLRETLERLSTIDVPADLEEWAFGALWNAGQFPPSVRDLDQACADIREALALVADLETPYRLRLRTANIALEQISMREHVLLMPGQKQGQQQH